MRRPWDYDRHQRRRLGGLADARLSHLCDWRTQLPQDLDAVIVPVDKLSNNAGETFDAVSAVTTTSDAAPLVIFAIRACRQVPSPRGRARGVATAFDEGHA
ncbi:MAG: hypothetical protein ACLTDR_07355 [Adlercreutzia equolifaciens]